MAGLSGKAVGCGDWTAGWGGAAAGFGVSTAVFGGDCITGDVVAGAGCAGGVETTRGAGTAGGDSYNNNTLQPLSRSEENRKCWNMSIFYVREEKTQEE